jgi:hypothetical protein
MPKNTTYPCDDQPGVTTAKTFKTHFWNLYLYAIETIKDQESQKTPNVSLQVSGKE